MTHVLESEFSLSRETRALVTGSKITNHGSRNFHAACSHKLDTIIAMILAVLAMRLLEVMFFVGLAGAAVVVLISFVEDFKELFGEE